MSSKYVLRQFDVNPKAESIKIFFEEGFCNAFIGTDEKIFAPEGLILKKNESIFKESFAKILKLYNERARITLPQIIRTVASFSDVYSPIGNCQRVIFFMKNLEGITRLVQLRYGQYEYMRSGLIMEEVRGQDQPLLLMERGEVLLLNTLMQTVDKRPIKVYPPRKDRFFTF